MDENTGTVTKGVFDFGAAPEAAKDEAVALENDTTTSNASSVEPKVDTTEVKTDTQIEGQEKLDSNEGTQSEEQKTGTSNVTEKPFEVNGRTFTSRDELVTAYSNSSAEGIRLAKANDEYVHTVNELNKKILELEEVQGNAPFPGLLSADKEQEAAQLEMLPSYRQTEYIINKKAWEDKQSELKTARAAQKAKLVESDAQVKELISKAEKEMGAAQDKYPGFDSLKPTMAKIIELTPSIANRPETPYILFWIAYGLNAFSKESAIKAKTKSTLSTANELAKSAHAQVGKSGVGKPGTANTTESGSSVVNAWRDRNGVGL